MTNDNYTGVTTGTIATACSLAALDAILDTPDIACVKVETPKKVLDIIIDECKLISSFKACAVAHKNPYNDPDVTVDLAIISTVELFDKTDEEDNIIITGGEGVGIITKPGLQIPVGDYAINPGPRRMIVKNLADKIPDRKVAKVTISIPEGKEVGDIYGINCLTDIDAGKDTIRIPVIIQGVNDSFTERLLNDNKAAVELYECAYVQNGKIDAFSNSRDKLSRTFKSTYEKVNDASVSESVITLTTDNFFTPCSYIQAKNSKADIIHIRTKGSSAAGIANTILCYIKAKGNTSIF